MGGGGGGGGGGFYPRKPDELRHRVRAEEDRTAVAEFETKLADVMRDLLAEYNGRDRNLTRERLEKIKGALSSEIDGSFDQLFGGSVAKRTHVEGMSDIDALVFINDSELEGKTPDQVLQEMVAVIREHLGDEAEVSHGRMAVTIRYSDGMEIQVLPALKHDDGRVQVPSSRRPAWSTIDPVAFTKALTKRNEECANKLVPTIKLAKAINGQLPEGQRLSGYHMESLGIAVFKNYDGQKTTAAMLPHFFERASELVLSPIKDSTGQSIHVDEYLGPARSEQRVAASHVLQRLARRMRNATTFGSTDQWLSLFGFE